MNKIINLDCSEYMIGELGEEAVDMIVTSPPYKDKDGYRDYIIDKVADQCHAVLKNNSACFVNFGHLADNKARPFEVVEIFTNFGFTLNDTVIWTKNHYKPIQGSHRLNNLFEYIFIFEKGRVKLDRMAIGVPYVHEANKDRYGKGKNLRCRGNVWHIPYKTVQSKAEKLHNDRFPEELPELCIKLASKPGDLILDPFMGSGTTAVAAKKLGRDYVGFELNKKHIKTAEGRLNDNK
jgi:site-specific DNA-methyltransferase (adenine-specific)